MSCIAISCFIYWLASLGQCWIEALRMNVLAFFEIWGENIQSVTIKCGIGCRAFRNALGQAKEVLFDSCFAESFHEERVLGFVKCFCACIEVIIWFFFFQT